MPHHAIQIRRDDTGLSGTAPAAVAAEPVPAFLTDMPGESEWYRWHGLNVHYKKVGSGPPVVFLHAVDVGASCVEWRRTLPEASADFTAYAVDLPGFGLSEIPHDVIRAELYLRFVHDFLSHICQLHRESHGLRVIASGAGAAYAAHVAANHPSLVDRLVLVAPTGLSACNPNPFGPLAFHALGLPLVSSIPASATSRSAIFEHLKVDVYGDDLRASMNEVDARFWVAHRSGADRIERARLASVLNVNVKPVIQKLRQPVLLLWGRRAKCPPVDDAETWKERHSRTLVGIFEQSGLCPHLEEPTKFNEAAMDFLRRELHVAAEAV